MNLELLVLLFVRSLRESEFELYKQTISKIIPYFFGLDRVNYARWLPIHLRDIASLQKFHLKIAEEFANGNFTVRKTGKAFSNMAIDQAHEQNNAVVNGDGGAIGLTEDPSPLRRWMVAGPELSRLVNENLKLQVVLVKLHLLITNTMNILFQCKGIFFLILKHLMS